MGGESPELAEALLCDGYYIPRRGQDIWALGLTMLDMLGARRPKGHEDILLSTAYEAEARVGNRLPSYLQYLINLKYDKVAYAEQVS